MYLNLLYLFPKIILEIRELIIENEKAVISFQNLLLMIVIFFYFSQANGSDAFYKKKAIYILVKGVLLFH
jgi:hypothetical protein